MASLLTLPVEVQQMILSWITETRHLKDVSLVCKQLNSVALPKLFSSITVTSPEFQLPLLEIGHVLSMSQSLPVSLLKYAKRVTFSAKIAKRPASRCSQSPDAVIAAIIQGAYDDVSFEADLTANQIQDKAQWVERNVEQHHQMVALKKKALAVLIRLIPGTLKEFIWQMGTCMPMQILGQNGYLPQRQPNLKTIHLITNYLYQAPKDRGRLALNTFKQLKKVSWTGLANLDDLFALRGCLKTVGSKLKELDLDFLDMDSFQAHLGLSDEESEGSNPREYVCWGILGLKKGGKDRIWASMERLSFSSLWLWNTTEEMTAALNWSVLRSLKLRYCPGWTSLFHQLITSGARINLLSLELQCAASIPTLAPEWVYISNFLKCFRGLKQLIISSRNHQNLLQLWDAVSLHKATLDIFVHSLESTVGSWGNWQQRAAFVPHSPTLGLGRDNVRAITENPSLNPFKDLNLEFLGITYLQAELKHILAPFIHKNTLKALHLRQHVYDFNPRANWGLFRKETDEYIPESSYSEDDIYRGTDSWRVIAEFHEFAQWVFGPDGIRSLQVLAFGDFVHNNRHPGPRIVLVRSPVRTGYPRLAKNYERIAVAGSEESWQVFNKYSALFQGCPHDSVITDHPGHLVF